MVFHLCLPCVVLVWWVGDCVLVVSCVAWAGLLELRFCIWFGTCCSVITCVWFLLAETVLVRGCVHVLVFVCPFCVPCASSCVGWLGGDFPLQVLCRFVCVVFMCVHIVFPCMFGLCCVMC